MVDLAGNSGTTARPITIGTQRQAFNDEVSPTDNIDLYSFRLTSRQTIRLNLSGLSADANLELRTQGGQLIAASRNPGNVADAIEANIDAGGYFIRVSPAGRGTSTSYRLDVAANPDGVGDRLSSARSITVGSQAVPYRDFVGWGDRDYYRFSVTGSSRFTVGMDGLTADANLQILSSTGAVLYSSTNTGRLSERISEILSAGTYYIGVVSAYNTGTNYRLNISKTTATINAVPTVLGNLPAAVQEASGLASGSNGTWWTHNDSGGAATLYRLNSQGGLAQSVAITGATNVDWEDIAAGIYQNQRVLFIGDFGNNTTNATTNLPEVGTRTDQRIYMVAEPDANATSANVLLNLAIAYPNNTNYDVEALAYDPVGTQLVLITKDLSGAGLSRVFTRSLDPNATQLTEIGTFNLLARPAYATDPITIPLLGSFPSYSVPLDRTVTSADISADGSRFVIRTYQSAFLLTRNPGESLTQMLTRQSQATVIPLVTLSSNVLQALQQDVLGEGIAFGPDGNLYTVNEKIQASTLPVSVPTSILNFVNIPDPHLTRYTL